MGPMETSNVDPATIHVWRWQSTLATAAATIGAVVLFGARSGGFAWLLPLLVAALGAALTWAWPGAYYRRLRFGVDAAGIAIERGIFWRSRIVVPRVRIQHTDVSQGPLQRRFGVGTLKLYTAGSRYTKIELPGLRHGDAVTLRDALLAESRDSGV
jgi:membrane protein YdbS with pleckstrin-like domain